MTYATLADLEALPGAEEWLPPGPAAREALLVEAEWAIDRHLVPGRPYAVSERVFPAPALLSPRQRAALRRATVFAAEYVAITAEEDALGGRIDVVAAGSVQFSNFTRDRPPGPRAVEALAATGLLLRSGLPYVPPEVL